MSSAFKDGVDAGVSDVKTCNSSLESASFGTEPDGFSSVADIAGRAPDFIGRMRSAFERIGENLHDDPKSWAQTQQQRLLSACDGLRAMMASVATRAGEGLDAANQLKELGEPGDDDDDDKKAQRTAAQQHLQEASDTLGSQVEVARNGLSAFYDTLRDVNMQFKNAIALAKNGADGDQSQVDQALADIRSLEDQLSGKRNEEKSLSAQRDTLNRSFNDLQPKIDDKLRAEQDADAALADGAKKDPPLAPGDLQSLEQASAAARQDRERAEADRSTYWQQTLRPMEESYWAKVNESAPLKQQLSALKQRRDTLMDGLNKSRTAFAEFSLEYQEPSL